MSEREGGWRPRRRHWIALAVLVAWLAAAGAGGGRYVDARASAQRDRIAGRAGDMADDIVKRIDQTLDRIRRVASVTSRQRSVIDAATFPPYIAPPASAAERRARRAEYADNPELVELDGLLAEAARDLAVDALHVTASSGEIIASSEADRAGPGNPIALGAFEAVPGAGEAYARRSPRRALAPDPGTGDAALFYSQPIRVDDQTLGLVILRLAGAALGEILPETQDAIVIAGRAPGGPVLLAANTAPPPEPVDAPLAAAVGAAVTGAAGGAEADRVTVDGRPLLRVVRTDPALGLTVAVYADAQPLVEARDQARTSVLMLAIIGALVIAGTERGLAFGRERALRRRQLDRQRHLLTLALENMSDAMAMVDEDFRYVLFNRRYQTLDGGGGALRAGDRAREGVRRDAGTGRRASGDADALVEPRCHALAEKRPATFETTTPDGRIWEFHQTPVAGFGAVMTARDVSERVATLRQLEAARHEAEAATLAKSRFLARMSHEIRTPMNGIIGMLELVEGTPLSPEQRSAFEVVRRSADSLLVIINDILDLSKLEAGGVALESIPVGLADIAEDALLSVAPRAVAHGLTPVLDLSGLTTDRHLGDPTRVRQILFNYLSNAVKFTTSGSITLAVAATGREAGGETVRFTVADTGIGMTEGEAARLFTDYAQADETTTRRFGGTGLGLSICRMLAELMGGRAWVESTPGTGSRFHFEAPFPTAPDAGPLVPGDLLRGVRLSLSGGSAAVLDSVAALLRRAGAACDTRRDPDLPASRLRVAFADGAARTLAPLAAPAEGHAGYLGRRLLLGAIAAHLGRRHPWLADAEAGPATVVERTPQTRAAALAAGTLLLLADDNAVNRDVFARQLARLGYAVDTARDGAEALRLWRETRYGAVVTDCHMPEMDGFQLARAIRDDPDAARAATPILAITASILEEDMAAAEASGIDAMLLKPVPMADLQARLTALCPLPEAAPAHAPEAGAATGDAAPAPDDAAPLIDPAVLRELVGDDPETIRLVLADFLETTGPDMAALAPAVAAGDGDEVRHVAHRIKGSCRAIGAHAAAQAAFALEEAGAARDDASYAGLHDRLRAAFAQLTRTIRNGEPTP